MNANCATNLKLRRIFKNKTNPEQILQRQYNYTRIMATDGYCIATKNKPVTPIGCEQTELIGGYSLGNILDATRFKLAMNFWAIPPIQLIML